MMKMRIKRKWLLISLAYLIPLLIVITIIAVDWSSVIKHGERNQERTFYLPQVNVYMRIHRLRVEDHAYVAFSRNGVFSDSWESDYFKFRLHPDNEITFVFNPEERDKVYVFDKYGTEMSFDNKSLYGSQARIAFGEYSFQRGTCEDSSIFYEESPSDYRWKPSLLRVMLDSYTYHVSIYGYGCPKDSIFEIKPISYE